MVYKNVVSRKSEMGLRSLFVILIFSIVILIVSGGPAALHAVNNLLKRIYNDEVNITFISFGYEFGPADEFIEQLLPVKHSTYYVHNIEAFVI